MKFALVCGASGNIGQSICDDLAQRGWSLYLHFYQNQKKIENIVQNLQQKYPKQEFYVIKADFRQESAVNEIASQIFSLDAIVFAQGTTNYKLLSDFSSQEIENLWLEQLKIPVLLIKQLIEKIALNHCGRIIFIGSIYGAIGSAMEVPYSMIKGGISSFANAYSKEVATLGVTVNVVAPGAVDTQMNQSFSKADKQAIDEEIPMGRFAKPQEISYIVASLIAKQASYINGQTIYVDGGWKK